jgi:hypothetical protein
MWFWSCVASAVIAIVIGFSWGGWVTGGTSAERVKNAVQDARADLAAAICVGRFQHSPDAAAQYAALKDASFWKRDDVVEKNGWANLPGLKEPVEDSASRCAERILEGKAPSLPAKPKTAAASAPAGAAAPPPAPVGTDAAPAEKAG